MLAQLIIGPAEEEKATDQVIQKLLEDIGCQVSLIQVDEAVQTRRREALTRQLSEQASLTVANSGIRWNNVTRLVNPELLPNSIVITSDVGMQHAWEIKPVIILAREPNLAANLRAASKSLKDGLRLPARTAAYVQTPFGLRLQDPGGKAPVDVWQSFKAVVNPGFRFSTRIRPDGSSTQFTITKVLDEIFVFKVDVTEQVVAVNKEELLEHFEAWNQEKNGEEVKSILINEYVMGILDWMDDSRLLT